MTHDTTHDGMTDPVDQLADLVVATLLAISPDDRLLLVVDESGWTENGDIAEAIIDGSRRRGAESILALVDDAPLSSNGLRTEYLPDAVAAMMPSTNALVSLTRTTSAPLPHHHVPLGLVRSNKMRGVFMVKRCREDLLGESVLGVDFEAMSRLADWWQAKFQVASHIRITTATGTELTASLDGMPSHRSNFAHQPGGMSPINWGEVYQGPVPGTTNGTAVIDGPILGYGWPETEAVVIHIEDGNAVGIEGDATIAEPLWELARNIENGTNIAELALGINPRANDRSPNVYKKGLGRLHVALGNGLVYDQGIDSEIHIDCIMPKPTVELDGEAVVVDGKPTWDQQ